MHRERKKAGFLTARQALNKDPHLALRATLYRPGEAKASLIISWRSAV
jgi:hypothetical protein